jgi:hypothetical protein
MLRRVCRSTQNGLQRKTQKRETFTIIIERRRKHPGLRHQAIDFDYVAFV